MTRATVLFALLLVAADWPQYRGPNRDGSSPETSLLAVWPAAGPQLLWTYDRAGVGYAGPAVVGDRLYVAGGRDGNDTLIALDIAAAKPREAWATPVGPLFQWKGNSWNAGPNCTPTVGGGRVFALGGHGDLLCADAATGAERWRVSLPRDLGGEVNPIGGGLEQPTPLGWGYAAAPLLDGDRLVVAPGGPRGLLAALAPATGKPLWRSATAADQASYSSPVVTDVGGVRQYVQAVNAGLVGVAAADGKLLWRYTREPAYDDVVIATPVVHAGLVFSSVGFAQGCDLVRLSAAGGATTAARVYSNKAVENRDGGVVRVGDHLYCHSENRGWCCVEMATGKVAWTEKRKLGRGSLVAADGKLILLSEAGELVLIDASPTGWAEHGRFTLPKASGNRLPSGAVWTHPVVAGGKLFVRDQELLFCFKLTP